MQGYDNQAVTQLNTCRNGVFDCTCVQMGPACTPSSTMYNYATMCAPYNGDFPPPRSYTGVMVTGMVFGCLYAVGLGGNDAANALATSVASGAIGPGVALVVGALAEWVGAVVLGSLVTTRLRQGISQLHNPDCWACGYCNSHMSLYMISSLVALLTASLVLLTATLLGMPVSATQTVVSAATGSMAVLVGVSCLNWSFTDGLGGILITWVLSPLFAGVCAVVAHACMQILVMQRRRPVRAALAVLPCCAGLSSAVSVLVVARKVLWGHGMWMAVCIALAAGLAVFLLVWLLGVPLLRRNLPSRQQHKPVYTAAPLSTVHEDESWGQHEYEHGQQEQGEYVQTGAQEETPLHEKESVDGGIARSTPRSTPMFDFGAIPSPVRSASRSMPSKLTLHEILSMQQQEGQASTSTHSTALHHGQHDGQHDGQPHATPQRGSIDARGHTSASDDGHPSSSGGDGGITRSSGGGITRSSGGDITNSSGNSSLRHKSLAQLHSLWKAYSQLQYSQLQSREQAEQGVGSMDEEYTNDDDNDENDEIKGEEGTGVHGGGAWSGGGSVLEGDAQQTSTSTSVYLLRQHAQQLSSAQRDASWVFKYLLVFQAIMEAFAHGGNDVANSTGPMSAIWLTWNQGLYSCSSTTTPLWILAAAGGGVALGMLLLGSRVMHTIGTGLTDIDYARGWCVEFASTLAVLLATLFGLPVSTTHCQVAAVAAVGMASFGPRELSWGLLMLILSTWLLVIPLSAGLAAALSLLVNVLVY